MFKSMSRTRSILASKTWQRGAARLLAAVVLAAGASQAAAQTFPDRPLRMVVPYSAGGNADVVGRQIASKLSEVLGQQVIVDNRPGAGGLSGTEHVAKAKPDGYTILFAPTQHLMNPLLNDKLAFDPIKDFAPLVRFAVQPLVVVVGGELPVKTVADLVAYSNANPDKKITYASPGNGSSVHLAGAWLAHVAGIKNATHIAYNNLPQSFLDVARGDVTYMVYPYAALRQHMKDGRLKALATTDSARPEWLNNVPTLIELGYKDFELPATMSLYMPAGTPQPVIDTLAKAMQKTMNDAGLKKTFEDTGSNAVAIMPAEFAKLQERDLARYKQIISDVKLKNE